MSSNVAVDPGDLGGTGLPSTNHLAGPGAEGLGEEVVAGRSATQLVLARLRHDKVAIASLAMIVIISLAAICAPLISRVVGHGPNTQYLQTGLSPSGIPLPPNWTFLFGTDDLGRDVLVRVVYGARISLLVGVAATGISITVGVVIGLLAGYYGSVVDTVLARSMDVVLSLPYLVFALALISIVGPSLWISILVIAFFSWATVGRVVRGQTLMLKEREFVEAARSIGTGDLRIMFVEILPERHGARHRLCHTPHPCRHRVRSNAVVPRPRSGTAHAELGEHARRIAALLLGRLVVRCFPRRGPAFDDSGVQPARRFSARRPGPFRPVTKDVR